MSTESLEMPELYNLWLTVKEFPCWNLVFRNARLLLHRPNTETKVCDYDFAALIQNYDPVDVWTDYPRKYITYDLFTADEKAAIEAYLATHHFGGITLHVARQTFPIPNHWAPCNATGDGNWQGEYRFDMEEGFDCPVKFWGYYRLSETPVVAGLAQVICESDGSITLNGLESPSIITARQAAILSKTWMRVKALGKPERLSLRYELPIGFHPSRRVTHALAKEQMV